MDSFSDFVVSSAYPMKSEIPKKVRFRDKDESETMDLEVIRLRNLKLLGKTNYWVLLLSLLG